MVAARAKPDPRSLDTPDTRPVLYQPVVTRSAPRSPLHYNPRPIAAAPTAGLRLPQLLDAFFHEPSSAPVRTSIHSHPDRRALWQTAGLLDELTGDMPVNVKIGYFHVVNSIFAAKE